MGKVATSATLPVSQEASNYDEVFMQQSLLFDDSLKVLMIFYLLFSWEYWYLFLCIFFIPMFICCWCCACACFYVGDVVEGFDGTGNLGLLVWIWSEGKISTCDWINLCSLSFAWLRAIWIHNLRCFWSVLSTKAINTYSLCIGVVSNFALTVFFYDKPSLVPTFYAQ